MSQTALGIDIGATNIKIVHVDSQGTTLSRFHFPTTENWPSDIKDHVAKIEMHEFIGVAAPGIASPDAKEIWWMMGRLSSVMNFDFARHLGRAAVPVLNDAHAALLGECWIGAARGARNVVMLTLGTGVGGAILAHGELLKGHLGRAGHLGHISLTPDGDLDIVNTPGSLENAIGDCTISSRSDGRFDSTESLVRAHLAGDAHASEIWNHAVKSLAAGITSIVNVVDPEAIIIGGGIASAGPALFDPLTRWLDKFEWRPHGSRVRIVPAALGDWAGALGAARYAMENP